jgi:threonine dehydratase
MPDLPASLDDIRRASEVIAGRVHRTPLLSSRALGAHAGQPSYLKAENLQKTGSFKVRGALNRLSLLSPEERSRGVITFSAGNHAQALAWAASAAGIRATVLMPADADTGKVAAARGYGAEVIQHPDFIDEASRLQVERGLSMVLPFDDPDIIAGAGTAGLEVVEDLPDLATVVVAIGGGGLIAGCAIAIPAPCARPRASWAWSLRGRTRWPAAWRRVGPSASAGSRPLPTAWPRPMPVCIPSRRSAPWWMRWW